MAFSAVSVVLVDDHSAAKQTETAEKVIEKAQKKRHKESSI